MAEERKNIVREKSFAFSLVIIDLFKRLKAENEFVISKQLLRSATSIGANIEEASAGFSSKDFIYKMTIASKEARETKYWLRLLDEGNLTSINVSNELKMSEELIRLLTAIVKTSQLKIKN